VPWIRIDEHALEHVKVRSLSHGAFRLWVEGLAHCQKHLTDGLISSAALKTFRYFNKARAGELTQADGAPPLWVTTLDGVRVHDYLQWNESRDHVLMERAKARERMSRLRSGGSSPEQAPNVRRTFAVPQPHHRVLKNTVPPEGSDAPPDEPLRETPEAFVALWNDATTPPLPRVRELTEPRRKRIRARLKERSLSEWGEVMERIQKSDFCCGRVAPSDGRGKAWVASFQWLINSPDNAVKVLEGLYDNRGTPSPRPGQVDDSHQTQQYLAEFRRSRA
jgi:hypothetical protein